MASSGTQWWRRPTHRSRPFRGKGAWFFVWFGYGDSLGNVGHDLGTTGVASITSNDEEVSSVKGRERGEVAKKASRVCLVGLWLWKKLLWAVICEKAESRLTKSCCGCSFDTECL